MDISGIILSGGKSKRMGKNKCLLKINNISFIDIQIQKINNLCSEIFISTSEQNPYNYKNLIIDEFYNAGPISGIYSALRKIKNNYALFLPCDMPLISNEILNSIIKNIKNFDAVVPVCNDKIFPVSAVYSKKCSIVLKNQIDDNDYKLLNFLNKINVKYLKFDNKFKEQFKNINTIKDYKKLVDESNKNL